MKDTVARDESEEAFLLYLRKPDSRGLARVVELLHLEVWKVALRVTGNEEEAADVTQDCFLGLLLSPPTASASPPRVGERRGCKGSHPRLGPQVPLRRRRAAPGGAGPGADRREAATPLMEVLLHALDRWVLERLGRGE